MSNFWLNSFPTTMPGGTVYGGGGGYGTDMLTARDPLDAKRMAAGFAPGASYPSGYLGNVTDRQDDKMAILQTRLTPNSYQRGVHKGERADPGDYFWNDDMSPDMGVARQSTAQAEDVEGGVVLMTQRYAPTGNVPERLAHGGRTAGMQDPPADPNRAAGMRQDLPTWSGARR